MTKPSEAEIERCSRDARRMYPTVTAWACIGRDDGSVVCTPLSDGGNIVTFSLEKEFSHDEPHWNLPPFPHEGNGVLYLAIKP